MGYVAIQGRSYTYRDFGALWSKRQVSQAGISNYIPLIPAWDTCIWHLIYRIQSRSSLCLQNVQYLTHSPLVEVTYVISKHFSERYTSRAVSVKFSII